MKELDIKYEMTFTCDEWLISRINYEWDAALEEIEDSEAEEREIFEIALTYALEDNYSLNFSEQELILAHCDEIYKWWKENT